MRQQTKTRIKELCCWNFRKTVYFFRTSYGNNGRAAYNSVSYDYEEIIKCPKTINEDAVYIDTRCCKQNLTIVPTFNISPKTSIEIPNLLLRRGDLIHYGFQIKTRNGISLRQSIFKVTPEKVVQSFRIYNLIDDKLTQVKEVNPLKISKEYWDQHFYSQQYIYTRGPE